MQSFLHRSTQRRRRRTRGRCEEEGGRAIPLPPMYSRSSMTKPPVMRGGEPFSPPQWDAQPSNAQPNTTRCIKPSRTVDSKVAVDMHIEVSREATKLNSQCVPPTTTSISKAKPCDADPHTLCKHTDAMWPTHHHFETWTSAEQSSCR